MPSIESYLNNPTRRSFLKGMAAAGAAVAAAGVLPGCSSGGDEASGEKVFRWAQANADLPFDMQRSTDSTCSTIAEAVVEGLLYWNDDLELECALAAEMPTWSDDGLALTVKLKQGVKFHNGADFTAEDVKFTFERLFTPSTGSLTTYMYDIIEGAQDMLDGMTAELSGLEIVDDYTVVFHVTTPYASFLQNLGLSFVGIFPHEACAEAGSDWGIDGNLIGTGPYKFVSGDGSQIVLEKNAEYHGDEPALDRVEITFIDDVNTKLMSFKNGEIDACDLDSSLLDQYKDDPDVSPRITYYDTLGTYFIVMNLQNEVFQDVRVRQALSLAINREEFVETMLAGAGVPAFGFLAPGIPGNLEEQESVFPYDPEEAKHLLHRDLRVLERLDHAHRHPVLLGGCGRAYGDRADRRRRVHHRPGGRQPAVRAAELVPALRQRRQQHVHVLPQQRRLAEVVVLQQPRLRCAHGPGAHRARRRGPRRALPQGGPYPHVGGLRLPAGLLP